MAEKRKVSAPVQTIVDLLNGKQPDTSNLVENTALFDATAKHLGTTREILIAGLLDEVAIPMLMTMAVDDRLAVLNASGTHQGYKQHLENDLKGTV